MRTSIIAVVVVLAGCTSDDGGAADLDAVGPPEILQVFVRERVVVTDDDGAEGEELQSRLAFGDHPDIDSELDDREVTAAAAGDGQRIRIVFDELLRGNALEEIPCADGSWSRVPVGTDVDDIARCAGADLDGCQGVCIGTDGPVGILDENQDSAIDDTRLIDGAVVLTCGDQAIALDPQRSYYQPSGSQLLSTASVGTDSLGPAVVIAPVDGLPPGTRCGLGFATSVVDRQGLAIGDTGAIAFTVEPSNTPASAP